MAARSFLILAMLITGLSTEALAKPPLTWAKPGVSLTDYQHDAAACATSSARVAVAIQPESSRYLRQMSAATLIQLAEQFNLAPVSGGLGEITSFDAFQAEEDVARRSYNFGADYVSVARRDVRAELQAAMDRCLSERGYVQMVLTADQKHRLARLKAHSAERLAYLHAIGSDATLIGQQQIVTPPPD